ncbi:hypothetical protein SESBI_19764 [Sesbania bispinosa]|nr:hypothetical protein SESBI_19764 [Sesbania bispinosa]
MDVELKDAEVAYRSAENEGNHQEEARWANVIDDKLKNRGEYVEALKWLRVDYEVSLKHLLEKHMLHTYQSLSEMYLCLEEFTEELMYRRLVEKAGMIFAWEKYCEFEKEKRIANELCDSVVRQELPGNECIVYRTYSARDRGCAMRMTKKATSKCCKDMKIEMLLDELVESVFVTSA